MSLRPPYRARVAAALAAVALVCPATGSRAEPRVVLAELFGTAACGPCAQARAALAGLQAEFGGQLVWIEYHTDIASPLGSPDASGRGFYYGIGSSPTLRVDGATELVGGKDFPTEYRAAVQARTGVPSPLLLDALFFFDGGSSQGSVVVTATVADGSTIANATEVVVRAVVLEEPAEWCCDAAGGDLWPRVGRLEVSVPLTVSSSGESQSDQIDFRMDPSWDFQKLTGIAFAQRETDLSILAALQGRVTTALDPVPVPVPDGSRVNLAQNFPNPVFDRTQIDFFLPEADDAQLRIVNSNGRVVRVLTDGPRTRGLHPMIWDGRDYRGRIIANGVYVYVLETSTVRISKRLVLLH